MKTVWSNDEKFTNAYIKSNKTRNMRVHVRAATVWKLYENHNSKTLNNPTGDLLNAPLWNENYVVKSQKNSRMH